MSVDFATFCCSKDVDKLYEGNNFERMLSSNRYDFNKVYCIYQECDPRLDVDEVCGKKINHVIMDNPREVSLRYITDPDDIKDADDHCGKGHHHHWVDHTAHHIKAAEASSATWMVFMDCDCYIKESKGQSWVLDGLKVLQKYLDVLYVCPNWGQGAGEAVRVYPECYLHETTSQQVILMKRQDLLNLDWDAKWTWGMPKAPGEPDAWYYWSLEGRLWRHMRDHRMYRASVKNHRWWHLGW